MKNSCNEFLTDFISDVLLKVNFIQDAIIRFSLHFQSKDFARFEEKPPGDFLKETISLSHTLFRAAVLQVCEETSDLINAMEIDGHEMVSVSPNTKLKSTTELRRSFTDRALPISQPEQIMRKKSEVTGDDEEDLEAYLAALEREETRFSELQRQVGRVGTAPRTSDSGKMKRSGTQGTKLHSYLHSFIVTNKRLQALRNKKKQVPGASFLLTTSSLQPLVSPSYHPAKSASLSLSESTTASRIRHHA